MLISLTIKNFTLIETAELDFNAGLSMITGETGTGKSLVLDALNLLLGMRSDGSWVRKSEEKAEIAATFELTDLPSAKAWLQENDIDLENEAVLRRIIYADGKSKAYINGTVVSLQQLKNFAEKIVDIHAQHHHYRLMNKDAQWEILDQYAKALPLANEVKNLYQAIQNKTKQIRALRKQQDNQDEQLNFLRYQLEELSTLSISSVEELKKLELEQKRLSQAESVIEKIQIILQLCDEASPNASGQLKQSLQVLNQIADPALENARNLLQGAEIQLQEATIELRHFLNDMELHPERLAEIEQSLNQVYLLARKHRVHPEEIFALTQKFSEEIAELSQNDENLTALEKGLQEDQQQYHKKADELRTLRKAASSELAKEVNQLINQLGMPTANFSIEFSPLTDLFSVHGFDDIEFLLQTNPDYPQNPLKKIISGGELSRLALAINVITKTESPGNQLTLIFDEVDTGIGGATAEMVGRLLRKISKQHQILCITHLPQVAAFGHSHFRVDKSVRDAKTYADVSKLSEKERVAELARMLGGAQNKTSQSHAKALLEMCED